MNQIVPPPRQLGQPPSSTEALRSVHTSNLPALFDQLNISLAVSTYQAGKLILVRNDGGVLNTHFRGFAKPMGIAADGVRGSRAKGRSCVDVTILLPGTENAGTGTDGGLC
jgi:hypothetical protein